MIVLYYSLFKAQNFALWPIIGETIFYQEWLFHWEERAQFQEKENHVSLTKKKKAHFCIFSFQNREFIIFSINMNVFVLYYNRKKYKGYSQQD